MAFKRCTEFQTLGAATRWLELMGFKMALGQKPGDKNERWFLGHPAEPKRKASIVLTRKFNYIPMWDE